jgi:hypothetical protein
MLLDIPHCTGHFPTTNNPAPKANSADVEKLCSREHNALIQYFLESDLGEVGRRQMLKTS